MITAQDVTRTILELVKGWNEDPKEINSGCCGEFSHAIWETLGRNDDIQTWWGDDPGVIKFFNGKPYDSYGHSFVSFQGMFYDAECPNGVDNPTKLPFYIREDKIAKVERKRLTVTA